MALLEVKSHTTLKKLLDMIPKEVLIIKTKNRVKFYELQLGFLDDMLLKQEMEDIEAREKQ